MIAIYKQINERFKNKKSKPKLVLQLHDELIYEVPLKHKHTFAKILKRCMEESVQLSVPFPVKLKCGKSWGTMEEFSL